MHVTSKEHTGTQEVCHVFDPPKVNTKGKKLQGDTEEPRERKN